MAVAKKSTRSKKTKGFSIEEAIQFGWKTTTENIEITLIFAALFLGLDLFRVGADYLMKHGETGSGAKLAGILSLMFIYWPAVLWVQAGLILTAVQLVQGKEVGAGDIFAPLGPFLKYVGGCLAVAAVVIVGFILMIVPGVILGIKYGYVPYLMLDRGLPLGEAFTLSGKMTDGLKWDLFRLGLAMAGVLLLGLLACCIGVFWAMVVMYITATYVYRTLLLQTNRALAMKKIS